MKKSFLSIALIASLALVGCGGGGGSSSSTGPAVTTPTEALVAGSIVSPIANNAQTILDYTPAASYRLSANNSDNFSFDDVSNNVQTALKAPVVARATLRAATMAGQFDNSTKFEEVTTFNNGVLERKVYKDIATNKKNPNDYLLYCKIDNCNGNINSDGILTSLTIAANSPITVDDVKGGVKFSGNITTDLSVIAAPNVSTASGVVNYDGVAIEEGEGYQYSKKITVTNLYSISKLSLNLSTLEVKDDFDYEHNTYTGITKGTNVKLSISGLSGTNVTDSKTIYCEGQFVTRSGNEWVTSSNAQYSSKLVVAKDTNINYIFETPVEIAVSGNISDTDTETNTTDSFTANNVSLKITELVEDDSTYGYRIEKGEAHVDVSSVSISEKLMIGNHEVAFDKAKIDITNLKYDDAWKSLTKSERRINIFKNAVVNISTEETKNKVSLTAKYVVADNKITATLTNNGSFIVKDKDNLLQFNFDKVDVTATNVKYVEQDSFEGSYIMVKGTERDGIISERTYTVQNQKLVLQNAEDKQLVTIPNELDKTASEIADEIKAVESNLVQSSTNPNLKIAVNNTGIKLATYQQEAVGENKKIDTKVMAKDNVICAVSYYGEDVYTVVFALDNSKPNMQIKGKIFSGKNTSATLDTTTNLIGTFTGSNGKINVVTEDGNSYDVNI